ncbi:MAG: hypothetical protein XXXJIFNMEKO3_03396 [Candidatus Erwinia impunctatus]|nr:hypothetical protein XXXJIFNMEKO_03396 [Culicoides impunctatus]
MSWLTVPPREKLLQLGAASLTDAELLALFLRTGSAGIHVMVLAEKLLREFGSLHHLMTADKQRVCQVSDVGMAKFAQLHAVTELARRFFACNDIREHHIVKSTTDLLNYLYSTLSHRQREIFLVIFFDNQQKILDVNEMFAGSLSSVEVHPREIIKEALKLNAAAIILAHNHPSGVSQPSQADKRITTQIAHACQIFDIRLLDHIVIGRGEYVSFAERGWL